MNETYNYKRDGRSRSAIIGLFVIVLMIIATVLYLPTSNGFELVLSLLGIVFLIFIATGIFRDLYLNPTYGITLSNTHIILDPDYKPNRLALSEVKYVWISEDDSGTVLKIYLISGEKIKANAISLPEQKKLKQAFELRNVTIERGMFSPRS